MAAGDIIVFDQFIEDWGNKIHDFDTDTFNFGLVDNTTTPTRDTLAPHWGGTGTTNFATWETTGTTAYTGPVALSGGSWTEAATSTWEWDFADPAQIAQDATGPNDIYWMIVYNVSDLNNRAAFAVDMGGPVSLISGPLTISFNANGIFRITGS